MTSAEVTELVELVERLSMLEAKIERLPKIEDKLDELLHLRSKGVGAFWLASAILGTSIIGILSIVTNWFKFK